MIKPLHQHHLITPTRCTPMMAPASRHWRVFKQLFADHWDEFQQGHPRYQNAYYHSSVAKMLDCGDPDKMGYIEYRCEPCGRGKHLVSKR